MPLVIMSKDTYRWMAPALTGVKVELEKAWPCIAVMPDNLKDEQAILELLHDSPWADID